MKLETLVNVNRLRNFEAAAPDRKGEIGEIRLKGGRQKIEGAYSPIIGDVPCWDARDINGMDGLRTHIASH